MDTTLNLTDEKYLSIMLKRIEVCKVYKPKFGQGQATTLEDFKALYSADYFYSWLGLDSPLVYAAHKTAGGLTSLYRQIGAGCEELLREIFCDKLGLTLPQVRWQYTIKALGSKDRKLSLDARIQREDLKIEVVRKRFNDWLSEAAKSLSIDESIAQALKGAVFEIRQGYKSKDSKRQNADITNATHAYTQAYLPVALILSNQIDLDVVNRYTKARWMVLRGNLGGSVFNSTYAFLEQIIGYDLSGFFTRNSTILRQKIEEVLETLLTPTNPPVINENLNLLEDENDSDS
jgi:hypothetical protein